MVFSAGPLGSAVRDPVVLVLTLADYTELCHLTFPGEKRQTDGYKRRPALLAVGGREAQSFHQGHTRLFKYVLRHMKATGNARKVTPSILTADASPLPLLDFYLSPRSASAPPPALSTAPPGCVKGHFHYYQSLSPS